MEFSEQKSPRSSWAVVWFILLGGLLTIDLDLATECRQLNRGITLVKSSQERLLSDKALGGCGMALGFDRQITLDATLHGSCFPFD